MPRSVLEAIQMGMWDYEPEHEEEEPKEFSETREMPGSTAKLEILAERVQSGLPLWHPNDRRSYDDSEPIPR